MMQPMMSCGCRAQGVCTARDGRRLDPPVPVCVVHDCLTIAPEPNLEGRTAKCSCGLKRPSTSDGLAFFVYTGPGSYDANEICTCGFHIEAHAAGKIKDGHAFTARGPREFDRYYCGCRGWD